MPSTIVLGSECFLVKVSLEILSDTYSLKDFHGDFAFYPVLSGRCKGFGLPNFIMALKFGAYLLCTAFIVNVERSKYLWKMFHVLNGQNCSPRNISVQT